MGLEQDRQHNITIKIASAAATLPQASTIHDPQRICGSSAAYACQHLESVTWRKKWPTLYTKDPDLANIWKMRRDDRWGYFEHHGLLWKIGPAGARLCLQEGADKVIILREMHDSKTALNAP